MCSGSGRAGSNPARHDMIWRWVGWFFQFGLLIGSYGSSQFLLKVPPSPITGSLQFRYHPLHPACRLSLAHIREIEAPHLPLMPPPKVSPSPSSARTRDRKSRAFGTTVCCRVHLVRWRRAAIKCLESVLRDMISRILMYVGIISNSFMFPMLSPGGCLRDGSTNHFLHRLWSTTLSSALYQLVWTALRLPPVLVQPQSILIFLLWSFIWSVCLASLYMQFWLSEIDRTCTNIPQTCLHFSGLKIT